MFKCLIGVVNILDYFKLMVSEILKSYILFSTVNVFSVNSNKTLLMPDEFHTSCLQLDSVFQ